MILRLLALLIALGLSAGVVQASDLGTPVEAALIEEAEDVNEAEVIVGAVVTAAETPYVAALGTATSPPLYQHQHFVFRPPRTPAFN